MENINPKNYMKQQVNKGQALVFLLFLVTLSVTITSAAIVTMIANSYSTNIYTQGNNAKTVAESGVENAILKLLRDPSYNGESIVVGEGTAVITVTGIDQKTIVSEGSYFGNKRKVEVIVQIADDILTIQSWKEIL